MSDRLALSLAIEDAGIPRDKAQGLASVIINLVRDTAATTADLDALRADVKADIRFLQWQIGIGFALVIAIAGPSLWLLLRVAAKLGAI